MNSEEKYYWNQLKLDKTHYKEKLRNLEERTETEFEYSLKNYDYYENKKEYYKERIKKTKWLIKYIETCTCKK